MQTYTVLVDYTDRTRLPDGHYRTFTRTVTVLADDPQDAQLLGAQLVAAIRADIDGMVLSAKVA